MSSTTADLSLNVPGAPLLHFEHFNFDHTSPALVTLFYSGLLSCTPDPGRTPLHSTTLWMNIGPCQIHLPLRPQANRLDGSVGLVIDPLAFSQLPSRLADLLTLDAVKGTRVALTQARLPLTDPRAELLMGVWGLEATGDGIEYYQATCPWGNLFDVFPASPAGTDATAERIGLAYGRIEVPTSAPLAGIAHYYSHYFLTPATVVQSTEPTAVVTVSPTQRLFFVHSPSLPPTPPYPSWHYCVYVADYWGVFERLEKDGLVVALDDRSDHVTDWKGAAGMKQFRALEMKGEDGSVVWGVEQEIRCAPHRHYRRKLFNEPQPMPREIEAELKKQGF